MKLTEKPKNHAELVFIEASERYMREDLRKAVVRFSKVMWEGEIATKDIDFEAYDETYKKTISSMVSEIETMIIQMDTEAKKQKIPMSTRDDIVHTAFALLDDFLFSAREGGARSAEYFLWDLDPSIDAAEMRDLLTKHEIPRVPYANPTISSKPLM